MSSVPQRVGRSLGRRVRIVGRDLRAFRPDWRWILGVLRSFVVSFVALAVSLWLLPGTQVTRGTESVAALAVVLLAVGALLRPLLTRLTVLTGTVGLLVAGVLAQAVLLGVALALVPTVEPFNLGEIVVASWAAAVVAAGVNWLFDASSDEAFFGQVMGQSVRLTHRHGTETRGVLVVQLDGVSAPLMRQAITAGAMPTVSRWLRSHTHRLEAWHTGLPATTPAGQAALLHGDVTAVPSFRWYDKKSGRLVVSSQTDDVAAVEQAFSTGEGLLAHGGVSISNLFSGDASTRILTMSDARIPSRENATASFAVGRAGFVRSFVLLVGQVLTELHQGRRQRRRRVEPRVRRTGAFVLLRGLTTVVLRDLNVSIVAEHMARSAPVIFVDFVDYDEVAHHAGPSRPESMRTLENLDRVLRFFDEVSAEVRGSYEIVVVSDHGQTQGTPFKQLTGSTLSQVVHDLAAQPVRSSGDDRPAEHWAPANLLAGGATGARVVEAAARRAVRQPIDERLDTDHLVVAASGNLAHVYLTDEPGRLSLLSVAERFPALVDGLAQHAHVGLVMGLVDDRTVRVVGSAGWRDLAGGETVDGEGADPTEPYGRRAAADLCQLSTRDHVGDLVVIGAFDPALQEVVAFEEQVGSHGGFGGWQTEALLIHPQEWSTGPPDGEPLSGLAVHRRLVGRLDELGLRSRR
jgi:predicted AlkP superfamily pyrophosphatase or phosphodiesterase